MAEMNQEQQARFEAKLREKLDRKDPFIIIEDILNEVMMETENK